MHSTASELDAGDDEALLDTPVDKLDALRIPTAFQEAET